MQDRFASKTALHASHEMTRDTAVAAEQPAIPDKLALTMGPGAFPRMIRDIAVAANIAILERSVPKMALPASLRVTRDIAGVAATAMLDRFVLKTALRASHEITRDTAVAAEQPAMPGRLASTTGPGAFPRMIRDIAATRNIAHPATFVLVKTSAVVRMATKIQK
jgi:hypothetical protein